MPWVQNTKDDQVAMLAEIGVDSIADLFSPIPDKFLLQGELDLPSGLSESQLVASVREMGAPNRPAAAGPCFLGGGSWNHGWPALVDHLSTRSEFLTAYTPYQPECSQGTLQWIYEFQSMIAEITGMEVANASMYDGASACAEAMLLALFSTRRKKVVVSQGLHPDSQATIATFLRYQNAGVVIAPLRNGQTDLTGLVDEDTAAVLIQQPNHLGIVESLTPVAEVCQQHGAWATASIHPVAMGLLRSPGEAGFDLVVGEGQSLGVPMSFGGPGFGFFATRQKHVRRMPGRLVGATLDKLGQRAFSLTFQTREQHIRREKATSNICTNNALMALRGCLQLAALGPQGLQEMACASRERALELVQSLQPQLGLELAFPETPYFQESCWRLATGRDGILRLQAACREAGIAAVLPLGDCYPEMTDCFTLACTEQTSSSDIAALAACFAQELNG